MRTSPVRTSPHSSHVIIDFISELHFISYPFTLDMYKSSFELPSIFRHMQTLMCQSCLSVLFTLCLSSQQKNLTCLTCAGNSVLLLALPYGDGHVVNGNVPLEARATNSLKHNLWRENTDKGSVRIYHILFISSCPSFETVLTEPRLCPTVILSCPSQTVQTITQL